MIILEIKNLLEAEILLNKISEEEITKFGFHGKLILFIPKLEINVRNNIQ